MAPASELREVVVREVLNQRAEAWVRPEEVLSDVGPAGDRELLEVAVEGGVHLLDEDALDIAGEEIVPLPCPDHLDDVPTGPAEGRLQLLDDLAVAADRPVEPLEVAVDDEGQVVEAFARSEAERAERLRLIGLAVAEESPDPGLGGVKLASVLEITVEVGLVDGRYRPEPHADGRELPEVRQQARMRVGRKARARHRLATEVVELVLRQATLEEGTGVDARRGVPLVEDLVPTALPILAAEKVVEPDLVEARGRGIGRQVATQTREVRLLLRADRVDVAGLGQRRQPDVELSGALEELVNQEAGPALAFLLDELIERGEPLGRLVGIDVGELMLEFVDVHGALPRSWGQAGSGRRVVSSASGPIIASVVGHPRSRRGNLGISHRSVLPGAPGTGRARRTVPGGGRRTGHRAPGGRRASTPGGPRRPPRRGRAPAFRTGSGAAGWARRLSPAPPARIRPHRAARRAA